MQDQTAGPRSTSLPAPPGRRLLRERSVLLEDQWGIGYRDLLSRKLAVAGSSSSATRP
jgi:hypothetical protein